MTTSTDDYKTQTELLINFISTRQETIADRWWSNCLLDECLHTRTSFSREEFMDQCSVLLHILTQRIAGESTESNLITKTGQYRIYRWQRGYNLADLLAELDNFYDALDEEIQQFLVLYPQTHPQVIAQVYRQLLNLLKDVGRKRLQYVDRFRPMGTAGKVQTLEIALDSLQQQVKQLEDLLRQSSHDLRSHLSIISTAASLIQQPLEDNDRAKFLDMISRNIKAAERQLDQILQYAQLAPSQPKSVSNND